MIIFNEGIESEIATMNILIATFSFPAQSMGVYDGKFVFSEAVAYAKAGARVRVITPYFRGAEAREKIAQDVTIYRFQYFFPRSLQVLKVPGLPMYGQKSFLAWCQIPFLCFFFCLAMLRHALWADIIHAQWTVSAFLALPAKWFLKKKIVVTARGTDIRRFPKWLNKFIHYQVDAAIDCFGPQPRNKTYKKTFSGTFIKLPLIVHEGTAKLIPDDMQERILKEEDPFIILYVGRFDRFKLTYNALPLLDLVHASSMLQDRNMLFHLFYIGGGDVRIEEELRRLIDLYEVEDVVSILGKKASPMDYMRFCDLGVGGVAFNAVSQEYTILGKPQILVDVPDNTNTPWKNGINALFVEPGNRNDLLEKLVWAINHRDELKRIGTAAKQHMERYIVDSGAGGRMYLDAFRKIITGEGKRPFPVR